MAKDRPTLLAVDGTALAFRAFFAIRGLTDELGRPSGALYGYLASLLRAIEELPHDHVVVAWDRPEPTFRVEIDPEYKANREELDEDLALQFPWLREATELLGIRSMDRVGFEADDILASLAAKGSERGWEVELYSSDKDLAQVVAPGVWQVPPPKQGQPMVKLGPAEIEEKYGLPPTRMAEWQALVGDSTDNIKGMPGVGAKRATTLLGKYPSLEELLDRGPEEEKGKLAENLGAHRGRPVQLAHVQDQRLTLLRGDVAQHAGRAQVIVDDHVDVQVAVDVGEDRAAAGLVDLGQGPAVARLVLAGEGGQQHLLELSATQAAVDLVRLGVGVLLA
ncbi:MAG: 5'-3' exonuclease, partial [Planctomycetota bacterium]